MKLKDIADEMRAAGVRRIGFNPETDRSNLPRIEWEGGLAWLHCSTIELFDPGTAPTPEQIWGPLAETIVPPPEDKGPGTCIALGCMENNGWQFDTRYCAPHGRHAAGVKL